MDRRSFLFLSAGLAGFLPSVLRSKPLPLVNASPTNRIFGDIMVKATKENWSNLPVGELMGKIGHELLGKPYKGGTLDSGSGPERCTVNLAGMDCVTFFENVLGIARIIKKGKSGIDDLIAEVTYTRYRGGKLDGYASRLHYTSDWIFDNVQKGVVSDVTKSLGGKPFDFIVNFMSTHPQYYKQLQSNPVLVQKIAGIEKQINKREYYYIPQENIAAIENKLMTGDIIAIATDKEGLDYAHTGLIYIDENGKRRLIHASSTHNEVILDEVIHKYVISIKSDIGITVVRPQEPAVEVE